VLLLCAGPVTAVQAADQTTAMRSGWQVGAGVGQSGIHVPGGFQFVDPSDTWSMVPSSDSVNAVGYQLFVGYRFSGNFALEGSYLDGGSMGWTYTAPAPPPIPTEFISLHNHPYAGALSAMGIVPLSRRFSLFARAGWARWWNDAELDVTQEPTKLKLTGSEKSGGFIWGGGASVLVAGSLLRVEYQQMSPATHLFAGLRGSVDARWRLISLSLVYML